MWESVRAFLGAMVKHLWALIVGGVFGLWGIYEALKPSLLPEWRFGFSPPLPALVTASALFFLTAAFLAYHELRTSAARTGAVVFNGPVTFIAAPDATGGSPAGSSAASTPNRPANELHPALQRPRLKPEDRQKAVFSGVGLRLTDLIPLEGAPVIAGRRFEDCTIYGPAVVFMTATSVLNPVIDIGITGTIESVLFELAPDRVDAAIGPVHVTHCQFERCAFTGIGFIGPKDFIDQIRNASQVIRV